MGRHGNGANTLPLQPQALQELPDLSRPTLHVGQAFDPQTGFRNRSRRLLRQRLPDLILMPSQFARRLRLPPGRSQSVEATRANVADIALPTRHRHAHNLRRWCAFQSTMQQPHNPQPSPHANVRVRHALGAHDPLFRLGQFDRQPGHDPPPGENSNGLPDHQRQISKFLPQGNISSKTERGIVGTFRVPPVFRLRISAGPALGECWLP